MTVVTCAVCGGFIYRHAAVSSPIRYPRPTGPWLHLDHEDWRDNPHNARPAQSAEVAS